MRVRYPKHIQYKASILGLEVIDFFILGPFIALCGGGVFSINPLIFFSIVVLYVLVRKTVLKRPRGHGKYFLQSLKSEKFLYIKQDQKNENGKF